MSVTPGTRLGHYEVISPLGKGGMGEVYLAADVRLGRRVALKVLPAAAADDQDSLARFNREARAASALNNTTGETFSCETLGIEMTGRVATAGCVKAIGTAW